MSQSPVEIRSSEIAKWRQDVIADLRAFADALESTSPTVFPTPYVSFSLYSKEEPTEDNPYNTRHLDVEDARIAMANLPGHWSKYVNQDTLYYVKEFGRTLRYYLNIDRTATCRRVQVGTKHIEATEAHDEPVYEWVCDDPEPEVTNG